ncbi:hypothetical protein MLD38_008048 [Melastoma candidum]|uniref:Uncharacterized protein n=1 Tax=Melastoma candidum TaxID=119954 RepID=A0ACB9RUB2_9MYRT|nr:hypothetical protein MLD38_008048 [Melastoma candidum]
MSDEEDKYKSFRTLVDSADRKFARVRDLPFSASHGTSHNHLFSKAFKSYMLVWKYQQLHRPSLLRSGLSRWEIGELASRIGQLYYSQYLRTSHSRYLLESFVFYHAIMKRRYFDSDAGVPPSDVGVKGKELRFYARFVVVCLVLGRWDILDSVVDKFRTVVDNCKLTFRETSFKEWKMVVQEILRFVNAARTPLKVRPLRYMPLYDTHPMSLPTMSRFHAKRALKFQDALLTSYHRNEVKFAELTLDTFRVLQCLEWEPSGASYQKQPAESNENGASVEHSGPSGLIDMHLTPDLTDSSGLANPRKTILNRPSVPHLIAVIATICEDLKPDTLMLIYLSAPGKADPRGSRHAKIPQGISKSSKSKVISEISEMSCSTSESSVDDRNSPNDDLDYWLCLGPKGATGSCRLYPADIIPFTRRPLFLIVDSDSSHAFKAIHGAERGEPAALFLSPLRPAYQKSIDVDSGEKGSQFTLFLTSPVLAFCQMVGVSLQDIGEDTLGNAEGMVGSLFAEWEVILCKSKDLNLVWAQAFCDPFIRRLILRFIFCRSALFYFCQGEDDEYDLPICLPDLPGSVSPDTQIMQSAVMRIANHFQVAESFRAR